MKHASAENIPAKIESYVSRNRLRDAFQQLRSYSARLGDWRLTDEIDRLEQSYSMMLRYATQGVDDPGRSDIYASIVRGIYDMTDRISRDMTKPLSSSVYFSTLRYEAMQSDGNLPVLAERYRSLLSEMSIYNLVTGAENSPASRARTELEMLERRVFNQVWIAYPFSSDEENAVKMLFEAEEVPDYFREMLVSALMLGLTHYYDERRLLMLFDFSQWAGSSRISLSALCGALWAMFVNRNRITGIKVSQRIEVLRDVTSWHEDVKTVFLQFIRTRDTERINRKMMDELIPEMMKLRPDIAKRMRDITSMPDIVDMEENPEWQELLDRSGITDKIKELSKMQEDGGDVFMSTFSSLKGFPFFSEVANWFMPFNIEHTAVTGALGSELAAVGGIIQASPFLCDGDKFSFVFALSSVPAMQKKMMLSQFGAQNINELELRNAGLGTVSEEKNNLVNKYVQGVYRFFKLFRRKGDFNDPFSRPLNLLQLPQLVPDLTDLETLSVVSEFYFKRGYYDDAFHVFRMLADKMPPDAQLFQKMGYCMQQKGDIANALEYYEQAELLNADSLWTLRRLAACNRMLDRREQALQYYRRIEVKKPDDLNTALSIGHCLLELGQVKEALNYYYKVEFLDNKSTRAWRPVAWASFVAGEYERSRVYYEKVLGDAPSANDYLNMGHLNLVTGDIKEAINYYNLSIDNDNGDAEKFISRFKEDEHYLTDAGVAPALLPLVVDALLYSRD